MSDLSALHDTILTWYAAQARDLPWRRSPEAWPWPEVDRPWAVLVSEVMLQQTPVVRVEPVWHEWMRRWPTPAALAAAAPGDAVREWGRLGYPRRALRLHAAATAIAQEHGGVIPANLEDLQALPGIGTYTAAAVGAFAFGIRSAVVDVNVRRVEARLVTGAEHPAPSLSAAETRLAEELLPAGDREAATWNVAVMELGALVCKAKTPQCERCPVLDACAWVLAGRPAHDGPRKRVQKWAGTDRQVRGKLLHVLRDASGPVPRSKLDVVWPDAAQRDRCLASLIEDGLVEPLARERFRLPA
ncbi:A/G-specific adenine glycosylase [Flexivirga sp. ID2601S]|uniref:Adenine DNA glycosylase n=1 Tax=Flexivirga aerilata TaxID=1656889 RepID=A0A849AMA2_9MICO|nr:A/G-specific adenine glycosylase [Flexivirga aerilata]NNG37942.1 A/G-specific adenine glycosylase [Flexivirga aerilata]